MLSEYTDSPLQQSSPPCMEKLTDRRIKRQWLISSNGRTTQPSVSIGNEFLQTELEFSTPKKKKTNFAPNLRRIYSVLTFHLSTQKSMMEHIAVPLNMYRAFGVFS